MEKYLDPEEEAAAEIRRAYHADWQRKNKDKVKGYQQKYWRKKARESMDTAETATARKRALIEKHTAQRPT